MIIIRKVIIIIVEIIILKIVIAIIKINVTSRRIAYFYYYDTKLKNYKGTCLWRYKDDMRLF